MIILIFHIFYFIIEMNDAEKKKYEEELQTMKEKQKKHEPVNYKYIQYFFFIQQSYFFLFLFQIHHPGSKQQLEEVWEKQDHMENEEFNPRTFFFFHGIIYYIFIMLFFFVIF